jgi:hypothetical protein
VHIVWYGKMKIALLIVKTTLYSTERQKIYP